jgi:hypothetical protein
MLELFWLKLESEEVHIGIMAAVYFQKSSEK